MSRFPNARAIAEIDTAALAHNLRLVAERAQKNANSTGSPRMIAVVKANAYGHGMALAVPAFSRAGCDFFAVATLDEAITVRKLAPYADILILGYTPPACTAALAEHDLIQTVFSAEYARELSKAATVAGALVRIHLKIDSGMCRLGFSPAAPQAVIQAAQERHLRPCGIYTHFPAADSDLPATRAALFRFLACNATLATQGLSLFAHAAASAALLALPESVLDGARVGLALYGISPVKTDLKLKPALTLGAPLVQIHEVPAGTPVGYGGTFVTSRPSKIGTVPIGYGDGLFRRFGEVVKVVSVTHKSCAFSAPIAGRICMDQAMIDLTDTPAELGDRVTFLGDAGAVADALNTIPYEIFTAIGERVTRIGRD